MQNKNNAKSSPLRTVLGLLLMLSLPAGLACGGVGVRKWRLASRTHAPIHVLTAAELIANGPGENAYVRVEQAMPLLKWFAVRRDFPGQSSWRQAFIPLAPAGTVEDLENAPRIILITDTLRTQEDIAKLSPSGSYEGVVVSGVDSLKKGTKDVLVEYYPDTNFDKCYLIDHNAVPPTKLGAETMFAIGSGLVLLFVLLLATRQKWMLPTPPRTLVPA